MPMKCIGWSWFYLLSLFIRYSFAAELIYPAYYIDVLELESWFAEKNGQFQLVKVLKLWSMQSKLEIILTSNASTAVQTLLCKEEP